MPRRYRLSTANQNEAASSHKFAAARVHIRHRKDKYCHASSNACSARDGWTYIKIHRSIALSLAVGSLIFGGESEGGPSSYFVFLLISEYPAGEGGSLHLVADSSSNSVLMHTTSPQSSCYLLQLHLCEIHTTSSRRRVWLGGTLACEQDNQDRIHSISDVFPTLLRLPQQTGEYL